MVFMGLDYAFAFNDAKFSDRLLRIEITSSTNEGYEDETMFSTFPVVVRVKELHISSPILAAKSPFFLKLFSNGMLESEHKVVTLSVDASEEAALGELLNFMYTNSLSVTTASALLDVLMVADKYEVALCMIYCTRLLLDMPWTVGYALHLLELPSSVLAADSVKPLRIAARQFLASHYKHIHKFPVEEVMALPLVGIEAILASDDLEVVHEDFLYYLVLKWAKAHYSDPQERQKIFSSRLARYIGFPHMAVGQLVQIAKSNDYTPSVTSEIILPALSFKTTTLHQQRRLAAKDPLSFGFRHVKRAYKFKPVRFMEFDTPHHECNVYLDLTRKECAGLYPSGFLCSRVFPLGEHVGALFASCKMDQSGSFHSLGLFLVMQSKGSLNVDYKFAARSKPTEEFVVKWVGNYNFAGGMDHGVRNLFVVPWESFMAKDSPYFINDILHLRAELSIRH